MKIIAKMNTLELIIQSPDIYTKPTIKGTLWDVLKDIPITAWLFLYKQPRTNKYEEIDFALALQKDPLVTVEWLEPIDGYESTEGYIV